MIKKTSKKKNYVFATFAGLSSFAGCALGYFGVYVYFLHNPEIARIVTPAGQRIITFIFFMIGGMGVLNLIVIMPSLTFRFLRRHRFIKQEKK